MRFKGLHPLLNVFIEVKLEHSDSTSEAINELAKA